MAIFLLLDLYEILPRPLRLTFSFFILPRFRLRDFFTVSFGEMLEEELEEELDEGGVLVFTPLAPFVVLLLVLLLPVVPCTVIVHLYSYEVEE